MNRIRLIRHATAIACLMACVLPVTSTLAYQGGSGIPSCHDDIAALRTKPGTSPDCTPPILDREKSLEVLKNFKAKKIHGKWYVFITAEEFTGQLDSAARWKTISLLTSAVESLFAEQADCLLVAVPESEEDKEALLAGNYPQRLVAASASYVALNKEERSGKKWPEYHHQLFYTITVY